MQLGNQMSTAINATPPAMEPHETDRSATASRDGASGGLLPISCFIIAKNEADRLPRALRSVRGLVDEIVVIDSGSTDGTQAIAEQAGARVVFNAWKGFGAQKRFGEEQCRNPWLLNIDADEVVSEQLAHEIRALFASGEPQAVAYGMWASIVYPGDEDPRPLARDHYVYRLYDFRRARFSSSPLFDSVEIADGPRAHLKGAINHHTVRSMDDLIAKSNARAAYNAGNARRKSRAILALRVVTELPFSFLRYYFLRFHVLGGMKGFQYATIISFFRFVRVLRMYEGQKADPTSDPNAAREV